jgi:putative DNA primase/helicase
MNNTTPFFPTFELPLSIRQTVFELAADVKAPVPLIVSSVLSAISLACQDKIDVRRPNGLEGPVSLFLITVAESGERKSSCDAPVTKPIKDFEDRTAQKTEELMRQYEADLAIWDMKHKALTNLIQREIAKEAGNVE